MIDRPEKFGGRVAFSSYKQLEEAYVKEEVYPLDLKNSIANQLNQVCECMCCVLWVKRLTILTSP